MKNFKTNLVLFLLVGISIVLSAQNNALEFNVQTPYNDYVLIGNNVYNQLYSGASGISFEGWINARSLTNVGTRRDLIFVTTINNTGYLSALCINLTQNGKLTVCGRSGLGDTVLQQATTSSPVITTGTWYHIAGVLNFASGLKSIRAYVNGVQVAVNTNPSFSNNTYVPGPGGTDIIGLHPDKVSGNEPFIGKTDDFRVWNYARSQAEIQADMYNELSLPQTGLIGYWKFNETSGTIAYDSSPSAKNGTLINFPTDPWVTGYPFAIRIYIDYPQYTLKYFESATVAVKIEGLPPSEPLRGYKVHLDFDETYLEVSGVDAFEEGSFLSSVDLTQWYVLEENGGHTVTGSILGYTPGAIGSGTLFYVTLKAKDQATGLAGTDVLLSDIILRDPLNHTIPYDVVEHCNIVIEPLPIYTGIKVFLQGPYLIGTGGTMRHVLADNSYVPLTSPYDPGFTISSYPVVTPKYIVDWLYVQLRPSLTGSFEQGQSCFILNDGSVVNAEGEPSLEFEYTGTYDYYLIVRHRNHLAVMSANSATFSVDPLLASTADLTQFGSIYGGNLYGVSIVETNVLALSAGDADQDLGVLPRDNNEYWRIQTGLAGYRSADFNLDGWVLPNDRNDYWRLNTGKLSQIPI